MSAVSLENTDNYREAYLRLFFANTYTFQYNTIQYKTLYQLTNSGHILYTERNRNLSFLMYIKCIIFLYLP